MTYLILDYGHGYGLHAWCGVVMNDPAESFVCTGGWFCYVYPG